MKNTIMLIDDSVTIHRVIDLCVDKERFNVVKVFSKDEAAAAIAAQKPDLVLLDNKLPETKAADMIKMIKDNCGDVYVILLAGAFDQFDEKQCEEAGADDFLFKPFDAKALDAKIEFGLAGKEDTARKPVAEESDPDSDEEPESADEQEEVLAFEPELVEEPAAEFEMAPEPEEAKEDEPEQNLIEETELPFAEISEEDEIPLPEIEDEEEELSEEMSQEIFEGLKETDEVALEDQGKPAEEEEIVIPEDLMPEDEPEELTTAETGDLFSGLEEADESASAKAAAAPAQQAKHEDTQVPETSPHEEVDELDGILDGINEERKEEAPMADFSDALEDAEESLAETQENLEEAASFGNETEQVITELDSEEIVPEEELELHSVENVQTSAKDEPELVIEEPEEQPELVVEEPAAEEPALEETVEEEQAVEEPTVDEPVAEEQEEITVEIPDIEIPAEKEPVIDESVMTPSAEPEKEQEQDELAEEPDKPALITTEKLVEAVYEAIDEETLKYAIKEVLTDKIGRILEEELPILVERAIRKEIERLVKGS